MVLIRTISLFLLLLVAALTLSPEVDAHKKHQKEQVEENRAEAGAVTTPAAMHERIEEHAAAMEARRPKTFGARLTRWLGQMHPFAVHFPIALFPVSWLALVIARRRGDTVDVIRSLIIVAGAAAAFAAGLGWLSAVFAEDQADPFLEWHRWLGTALGILGALVAVSAWRSAASANSRAMMWLLGAATFVLLVQGWLGAVLVHGMEHMAF